MAELFDRNKSTISRHINNVFEERELERSATVASFATVQNEGDRQVQRQIEHFNLDVIISVGYRAKEMQQLESDFDRAVKQLSTTKKQQK